VAGAGHDPLLSPGIVASGASVRIVFCVFMTVRRLGLPAPSIHWGKLSNRDHRSHAVVTSTFF